MSRQFDVAIVGSGFSGAALACILARNGLRVLVMDSGVHPRFAIGESTAPQATMLLRILGVRYGVPELSKCTFYPSLLKGVASTCGVKRNFGFISHRAGASEPEAMVQSVFPVLPYGPEHHFFRQDIDFYLAQAAVGYGAEVWQGETVAAISVATDGVSITTTKGQQVRARFVVDATGFKSALADELGVRELPTRLETQSRSIYTHMLGVRTYESCLKPEVQSRIPSPFSEGTLHHIFDGGWLWVIPFDNHARSTNHLVSVGLQLDPRKFPKTERSGAEEFAWFLERFPALRSQFARARPARPWVTTDRLQYSSRKTVGARFCLMSHASGFVDPLYSRGLVNTFEVINQLAALLIEAARDDDFTDERFAFVEKLQQNLLDFNDRIVRASYISWADTRVWRQWYQVWALGSFLGGMRLNKRLTQYMKSGDKAPLGLVDDIVTPGLIAPNLQSYTDLFFAASLQIGRFERGEIDARTCEAAIARELAATGYADGLLRCGLFRFDEADWHRSSKHNVAPFAKLLLWARRSAPREIYEKFFDYDVRPLFGAATRYAQGQDPLAVYFRRSDGSTEVARSKRGMPLPPASSMPPAAAAPAAGAPPTAGTMPVACASAPVEVRASGPVETGATETRSALSSSPSRSGLSLPPRVPGLPIVGNVSVLFDPVRQARAWFRDFGPIFRVQLLNREFTVLAGLQANRFITEASDRGLLSSAPFWADFKKEVHASNIILGLDGEEHSYVRKLVKPGYGVELIHGQLPKALSIVDRALERLQTGQLLELEPFFQRLVTEQLGLLLTGTSTAFHFDDIELFMRTALNSTVLGLWPRLMLRRPGYARAKARLRRFVDGVVQSHRSGTVDNLRPDLVDELLARLGADSGDLRATPEELFLFVLQPFIAGIDTAGKAAALGTHCMLKDQEVFERVQREADELLSSGPTPDRLKKSVALHGLVMETLRMHPIAAFLLRRSVRPFEAFGYRVEADQDVVIATAVTNYLGEYFPEPERFDIDRHQSTARAGRISGSFIPYGAGPHACLGARISEVQLMLILAAVARSGRFTLERSRFKLRPSVPTTASMAGTRVHVREARHASH